jgi:hypothetical protein
MKGGLTELEESISDKAEADTSALLLEIGTQVFGYG